MSVSLRASARPRISRATPAQEVEERPDLAPFKASLFPYIPGIIAIKIVYVVGKQRSGKSTMVRSIVADLQRARPGKVFFMLTNDSSDIYENFHPEKRFNVFFVDDAGDKQFSYDAHTKEMRGRILKQKRIAHLAEAAGIKEGCITVFIGAQNDTLVGYQLRRDSSVYMVKSLNLTLKADRDLLTGLKGLDQYYREEIERWILSVDKYDKEAMSRSLVIFLDRSWGWFFYEKQDDQVKIDKVLSHLGDKEEEIQDLTPASSEFLKALDLGESEANLASALTEVLAKMEDDQAWRDKVRCYRMAREGRSQREIALLMFGEASKQSTVSGYIKSGQGEAKRRLGAIYEKATEIRLTKAGYKAARDGRNGRPDIIASKDGRELIISCKIYEDPKKLVSIEAAQFRPEINEAKVKGLNSFVLFFYNLAWEKEIVKELDKDLTTATLRLSEAVKMRGPISL